MQKMQVDYKPQQPFINLKEGSIWHLIDITEAQSLVLKTGVQTIVHLYNKETKKVRRLRFSEFETQFELIQSGLVNKVIAYNKLLEVEATNHFD